MRTEFTLPSADGRTTLHAVRWQNAQVPVRAVLQLSHGMVEYIERYDEFAEAMAAQGFLVVGHDHLGHGGSVVSPDDWGYFAEPDGDEVLIQDLHSLRTLVQAQAPGLPYFMLGHSMGSYLLRRYLCVHGEGLAGALIVGTGCVPGATSGLALALCRLLAALRGWRCRSRLMEKLFFSGAFTRFDMSGREPERSWLSRDTAQVRAYYAEPRCTFHFTLNGFYYFLKTIRYDGKIAHIARTPKALPLLFLAGDQDPVGNFGRGVEQVCARYRRAGLQDVQLKLYPEARHEILNETNRQEVYADRCRQELCAKIRLQALAE